MLQTIFGTLAIILTFVGYVPYIRDIVLGKTKPHLYSWLAWGLVGGIVFALQIMNGAGAAAYVTLAAELACVVVIILTLNYRVASTITSADTIFLTLALLSLALWLLVKQPLLAAILATITDLLSFIPTIRKSWQQPHSETLLFYVINIFRFGLAALALSAFTVVTALYPISWFILNSLFVVMLLWRRRYLGNHYAAPRN